MKRYAPRALKWFVILSVMSAAMLVIGIISIVINIPNVGIKIGLIGLGGLMSILFFSLYLAEKSRSLVIDVDKITFPRGVRKNGKIVLRKTIIRLDTIRSIESKLYKGDGILSGDCFFHTLKLKDDTDVTVTLYEYGKNAEKEILEVLQNSVI